MTNLEIANIFTYHAPKGDQAEKYVQLRNIGRLFAESVNELCPESREKSIAITKMQEAVMFANAAIAIHG